RPRRVPGWSVEKDAAKVVDKIGGVLPASELVLLSSRLSDPGPWLTLIHGDPCPDNSLLVGEHVRLIDYEFSQPSHALLDRTYWRLDFQPAGAPDASRLMSPPESKRSIGSNSAIRSQRRTMIPLIASNWLICQPFGCSPLWHGD